LFVDSRGPYFCPRLVQLGFWTRVEPSIDNHFSTIRKLSENYPQTI
jgi:hypothetical protein